MAQTAPGGVVLSLGRLGVLVSHLPSAILSLSAFVSRSPPDNSCMYPSWISRSLCSAGIVRCIKPLAQSRNETNSSWVNGADKSGFIFQICASGAAVQARFVCHNQTDPLPLSEGGGPNTAQIDVVLSVPVLHPALPVDFFHTVYFPANFTCKRKPHIIMAAIVGETASPRRRQVRRFSPRRAHLFMVHSRSSDTSGLRTQSALGPFLCCAATATSKSRQGFPRRLAVALRLRGGVLRRAVLERSRASLAIGRTASMRRPVRCQCVGPTIPDSIGCVTSDDADQASFPVL
jgi:hypothetical protein